ncbi:hypothetical protein R1flu_001126 [Riccia fluitans]|uniref:Uncharacterized protein n=1 Tax=Riccia fluitans TaxID=41844 RepID=A0ABD1Y2D6_9MARC
MDAAKQSMAKQQVRGWKEPSPGKKVSEVEAAYVVQSYLIEKQFTTTLAGFQVDAAPILSSLKNAPPAVRSLTTILNDYVLLREKQQTLQEENARLEQKLKEAHHVLQVERSRMSSFVQGIHENLALYQTGRVPPNTLPLPSVSNSPSNSAIVYQVRHVSLPGAGIDTSKTPSSVRGTTAGSTTNKRKKLSKISQELPSNEVPSARVTTSKKPRPSLQVSGPISGEPPPMPWMCGMVRKNSMNMVRPVLPIPFQEAHVPPSVPKTPQQARPAPGWLNSTQCTSASSASTKKPAFNAPVTPSGEIDKHSISSSVPPTSLAELPDETCLDDGVKVCQDDPHTPPNNNSAVILCSSSSVVICRNSSVITPLKQAAGIISLPPLSSSHPSPTGISSSVPPSALAFQSQQTCEDKTTEITALHVKSRGGPSPESYHIDKTRVEFHLTKAPSKISRPLDFSDSGVLPQVQSPASQISLPATSPAVDFSDSGIHARVESPASQISHPAGDCSASGVLSQVESPSSHVYPPTTSPPPEYEDASACVAQSGENPEHNTDDLFLIDDILASLDDPSFSSLGDMLVADEMTMNGLVVTSQSYSDVDFSNFQSVTNRSLIGEDSFGFQCSTKAGNGHGIGACVAQVSPNIDSSNRSGTALDGIGDSSQPCSLVLTERDPNRSFVESSGKRSNSSTKQNSKREVRSKSPPGQENSRDHDSIDTRKQEITK